MIFSSRLNLSVTAMVHHVKLKKQSYENRKNMPIPVKVDFDEYYLKNRSFLFG